MRKINRIITLLAVVLLLASCAHRPSSHYFGSYSEAEKYYKQGEYEKAIQHYEDYIAENTDGNLTVIASFYIAKSHASLGHNAEAEQGFRSIIENYPDLPWAEFSKEQLKLLGK